jgi:hypothetical protein
MEKLFYRIGAEDKKGLWYNTDGTFSGAIHKEFTWLNASNLNMPFENELIGYISVADSLEHLYQWFTKQEILKLQEQGFSILEYKASDYKFYDLYKHNVINQETSILHNIIILK